MRVSHSSWPALHKAAFKYPFCLVSDRLPVYSRTCVGSLSLLARKTTRISGLPVRFFKAETPRQRIRQFPAEVMFNQVTFLGTSSATPIPGKRNVSSLAISNSHGTTFLVDCGEGTQHQIMLCPSVRMSRINYIFITHLHGDHCYGIFGLLASMGLRSIENEITVIGPVGIKRMVETVRESSGGEEAAGVKYIELEGDQVIDVGDFDGFHVSACPLEHRVPTYGYVFEEPEKSGALDGPKAMKLGAQGKQLGRLKNGEDVQLADGTIVLSKDCLGDPTPGVKIVVLQDTQASPKAIDLSRGCDLLIHECTYHEAFRQKALEWGHSTSVMAGEYAKLVEAKVLGLTHFSSRYCKTIAELKEADQEVEEGSGDDAEGVTVNDLLEEAKRCCEGTTVFAAEDFMTVRRSKKHGFVVDEELSRKGKQSAS